MRTIPVLALILVAATGIALAQSQPTLEERMSQADFQAAGLDKLSPQELAQLNAWLDAHAAAPRQRADGRPDFYPDSGERSEIQAHIVGDFSGWIENTTFTLDNGQVWKPAEASRHKAGSLSGPAVTIKPMSFDSWLMYVDGCGCSLRVRRIR